jgi:hypothetical protein
MDRDRVLAMNAASLETFFEHLQDCISHNSIDPEDMWNFDEKGFMMGRGGKKNELVISRVRMKMPRRMQQGNREWVTLIECVSATGIRLPAFYIYAGVAHSRDGTAVSLSLLKRSLRMWYPPIQQNASFDQSSLYYSLSGPS